MGSARLCSDPIPALARARVGVREVLGREAVEQPAACVAEKHVPECREVLVVRISCPRVRELPIACGDSRIPTQRPGEILSMSRVPCVENLME